MPDNLIQIGFDVDADALKSGLDSVLAAMGSAVANLKQQFAGLDTQIKPPQGLVDFQTALATGAGGAETQRKATEDQFAEQVSEVKLLQSLYQMSADDAIAEQERIENKRFTSIQDQLQAEATAANTSLQTQEQLQKQLDALETQHDAKMRALTQQEATETLHTWQSVLQPISSAFSSSITAIIQGHETMSQALAKIGQSIESDFVNLAVKRATNWLESELTMTTASTVGDATRNAEHKLALAEGQAADAAAGSATVLGDANKAFAGAYSAVAGIPYVGPVLAPIAGAAAFAAVAAYDLFSADGGFDIPSGLNPVTQLHAREMVLPANIAEPLRAGLASGGGIGGNNFHAHFGDINVAGNARPADIKASVVAAVKQGFREGAFT
jgi:hypothetical protein